MCTGEAFGGAADKPIRDVDTLVLATSALRDSLSKVTEYVDAVVVSLKAFLHCS